MSEFDDPMYGDVLRWAQANKSVTVTKTQRAFRLGWNRASHLIERMHREGFLGAIRPDGTWKVVSAAGPTEGASVKVPAEFVAEKVETGPAATAF